MINDSAGIEVPLIDKSERTSTAVGFRSAAVIEAVRGLCEKPTLITSAADYVKVFGAPSVDKTGMASIEAYSLSQREVPQVIVRAKKTMQPGAKPFPVFKFEAKNNRLDVTNTLAASAIAKPSDPNFASLYFKGEGDYACKRNKNIVLRFSKPSEESAYADDHRVLHLQVFDFEGNSHVDTDQEGKLIFNPAFSDIFDATGSLKSNLDALLGFDGEDTQVQYVEYGVRAFVNGFAGVEEFYDASGSGDDVNDVNFWQLIESAIAKANTYDKDETTGEYIPAIPRAGWEMAGPSKSVTGNTTDKYIKTLVGGDGKGLINAFDLSISVAITAKIVYRASEDVASGYYELGAGTVSVSDNGDHSADITVSLSSSIALVDKSKYMFTGKQNRDWAAFYETYCKESWDLSFSYDDYDASYVSLQADAVLSASNYLVCKTNDIFGSYKIDWGDEEVDDVVIPASALVANLQYFDCDADENTIEAASKSFAYSRALSTLLTDNLTKWRCLCTPNLGDVMIKGDYVAAIEASSECTLGLSNIGRAASVDALHNLNGRHGNRFIADFSVYGYRSLNGRRTPFTMACLVTELLHRNYKNGNEARPPFGYEYGQINCNEISQEMTGPERQMLARTYKVNPVMEDGGFYLWDERTSQLKETSLSDEHSIISFIWMKFGIYDTMKSFIAEYNDEETVNRGLSLLNDLCQVWTSKKYVQEAMADAKKNVIGDEYMRFTVRVRFKGVARYVVVEVVAYPQTQSLAISLAMEEAA